MKEVWDNVATDGVMTKAQELGMSVDLPPEIPGCVDTEFKDVPLNVPIVQRRVPVLAE